MVQTAFFLFGLVAFAVAALLLLISKSAFHEIEVLLANLIGWTLWVGCAIDYRLCQIRDRIPARRQRITHEAPPAVAQEPKAAAKPTSQMTLKELLEAEKGADS